MLRYNETARKRSVSKGRTKPMSEFKLLIDGKMVPGDQTMAVLNPATEEVLAQCPRASEAIEANTNELARILTSEQGKPLADATIEVMGMAAFFRYLSSLDLPMKVIEDSGD